MVRFGRLPPPPGRVLAPAMSTPPARASYACGTVDGAAARRDHRRQPARWPYTRTGDREAVVEVASGRRLTYGEFDARVQEVARGLLARGLQQGDRVGIWAPNCIEWMLVQYATARIGVILVTINPAYRTHELEYVLNQAGISTLVAARQFKTSDYRAMIERGRGRRRRASPTSSTSTTRAGRTWSTPGRRSPTSRSPSAPPASTATTRSTSSTPRARRASPRARRCRTSTSSTTASSSARCAATPRRTGSACRCPSTTASAWSWAISPRPATAPASSSPRPASTRPPRCARSSRSGARRSTACRRCSSPSWPTRPSARSTCPACAPGSWPAPRARSR